MKKRASYHTFETAGLLRRNLTQAITGGITEERAGSREGKISDIMYAHLVDVVFTPVLNSTKKLHTSQTKSGNSHKKSLNSKNVKNSVPCLLGRPLTGLISDLAQ